MAIGRTKPFGQLNALYPFQNLPFDMQVLLFELTERAAGESALQKLEKHSFRVETLPIKVFPSVPLSTDCRDEHYALAMVGKSLPPVVIHGNKWIDGRHRVWALKVAGAANVECINLDEVFPNYPDEPIGVWATGVSQKCSFPLRFAPSGL